MWKILVTNSSVYESKVGDFGIRLQDIKGYTRTRRERFATYDEAAVFLRNFRKRMSGRGWTWIDPAEWYYQSTAEAHAQLSLF